MTEKLYYKDAYMRKFSATVLECERTEAGYSIVLDKTAFFPEEGGQYSDRGYVGEARIVDVRESDGTIYHIADRAVLVGSAFECRIDFDERYEKMQCHTAEHIISGLVHAKYGLDNVGFHLGRDYVTMDISGVLDRMALDEIENAANEVVFENVEVCSVFPTKEELASLDYRSKLDITENVRVVNIGAYDSCACCAPHVSRTGECGVIKILDFQKLRGGIRMFITAGRRALLHYRALFSSVQEISQLLSVPKEDISEGVRKLARGLDAEKLAHKTYRISQLKIRAASLESYEGNRVIFLEGLAPEELRAFASDAAKSTGGIFVALTGEEGDYKYVAASGSADLKNVIKDINTALRGRGGGSPSMMQGSFAASLDEIKAYFEE